MKMEMNKGDIFLANLEPIQGSEQGGIRPVLVIQNDISNRYSPVTIIAAITSKVFDKEYPTNVEISKQDSGLKVNSTILLNQLRTIDNKRLLKRLGSLDERIINKINLAIKVSLGLK